MKQKGKILRRIEMKECLKGREPQDERAKGQWREKRRHIKNELMEVERQQNEKEKGCWRKRKETGTVSDYAGQGREEEDEVKECKD